MELAVARLTSALTRVAAAATGGVDSPVLVVSHGGLMRLWLQRVLGTTIPLIGNGTVYVIDQADGGFRAAKWGA